MIVSVFRCCAVLLIALAAMNATVADPTATAYTPPDGLSEGWYARIETSLGTILARLLPEQAPQPVAYFAGLAEGTLEWFDPVSGETKKGHYYDRTRVYRAEAGLRFDVGEPSDPNAGVPDFYVPRGTDNVINFSGRGRLGMARSATRGFSGALFFVTASPLTRLSGSNPCFGRVISGSDVVYEITAVKTHSNGRPIEPVTIEQVRVFAVGNPPPLAEPKPYRPQLHAPSMREYKPKPVPQPSPGEG